MFTGIVKEIGMVLSLESKNGLLEINVSSNLKNLKEGDSVSVNGCCQTIVQVYSSKFIVQAVKETLDKTNLNELKVGSKVNLEPSLTLADKLDGHLVSGHVDSTGEVIEILNDGENQIIKIGFPETLNKYIAPKGSISVNGVSLTVMDMVRAGFKPALTFSFTLIPYTRDNTNLGLLEIGSKVNLEVDLVSRYLVNYLEKSRQLTRI